MPHQTPTPPPAGSIALVEDERVLLLEEVDFKWLMAGQGWWIDTGRLRTDPAYAAGLLQLASASQSAALRACAASLQKQGGIPFK